MHQMRRHGSDLVCMKVRFSLGGGLLGGGSLGYISLRRLRSANRDRFGRHGIML